MFQGPEQILQGSWNYQPKQGTILKGSLDAKVPSYEVLKSQESSSSE